MATYWITRKHTPSGTTKEQRVRKRRDAAALMYRTMLWEALHAESLLDRPIAHRVISTAASALKPGCMMQGQSVGEWYVTFEKID